MPTYTTPGVYIEEQASFPPSVAEVSTAIPAFIGTTKLTTRDGNSLIDQPVRISNFLEYREIFGGPELTQLTFELNEGNPQLKSGTNMPTQMLYHQVDFYFKNGGGACYIVSIGNYQATVNSSSFSDALDAISREDEPTLLVFPDALRLDSQDYYSIVQHALAQCATLGDRFTLIDVPHGTSAGDFRNGVSSSSLQYGAAYTPYIQTTLNYHWDEKKVLVEMDDVLPVSSDATFTTTPDGIEVSYSGLQEDNPQLSITTHSGATTFTVDDNHLTIQLNSGNSDGILASTIEQKWGEFSDDTGSFNIELAGTGTDKVTGGLSNQALKFQNGTASTSSLDSLKDSNTSVYSAVEKQLNQMRIVLPPSAGLAGIYAAVDRGRGVWKAPANVSMASVLAPVKKISNEEQGALNVDPTSGKSINAIRSFTGKGTLVWGARTLAGNSNDWRYISVRRLFNTVEESLSKATDFAVFESNDANTWLKVKGMCESYLFGLYEQGAFAGNEPNQAYYVNVGLGTTMTSQDVLEGRMIVEIGLAPVRPAEFIILRFSQKIQE